jgi:hypothetical protein
MQVPDDIHAESGNAKMKAGDRVIWLYSKKRSIVVGCHVQRVPGVVIRICKRRVRLKVLLLGSEKLVNVSPDNIICE